MEVIISLTTYPARVGTVHLAIKTLLAQSLKAKKVLLWLAREQFPNNEADLPPELLELKAKGLTIKWCEDIKSYKKLIPALIEYPNCLIATADDDIYYPKDWLKKLYSAWQKEPQYIHAHRAHRLIFDDKDAIAPYIDWPLEIYEPEPSFNNFPTSGAGALWSADLLSKEILTKALFLELSPNADDIWFWAMAVLNGTKINVLKNGNSQLKLLKDTQEDALWRSNLAGGANDAQLRALLEHYPQITHVLDRAKYTPKKSLKRRILKELANWKNSLCLR